MKIKSIKNFVNKYLFYYDVYLQDRNSLFWKTIYFFDVVLSFFIYGSTITDYFSFEFYKKKAYERNSFITWRRSKKLYKLFNGNQIYRNNLKSSFYDKYNEFLGRKWLRVSECSYDDFEKFIKYNLYIMVKVNVESGGGNGVYKLEISENTDLHNLYRDFKTKDYIVEEYIKQHKGLAKFHPNSVNTVRITTIKTKNKVNIVSAIIKLGNGEKDIDNLQFGGIFAEIDINTGMVVSNGVDKFGGKYIKHPFTKENIIGFCIPLWHEILDFVKKLSEVEKEIRYVGWDIAITSNCPILLEGNYDGAVDIQQQPSQIGLYKKYKDMERDY